MKKIVSRVLDKVLLLITDNPEIMNGFDISSAEVMQVEEESRIELSILIEVVRDDFLECIFKELGITLIGARKTKEYFMRINNRQAEIMELKKMYSAYVS